MTQIDDKLLLSTHDYFYVVKLEELIYCKSENSYTTFYLQDEQSITVSVSIKKVEALLTDKRFVRSHQSFLINMGHIKSIHKAINNELIMTNGEVLPISSRRKKELIRFLSQSLRIQIP
jgi:two-component system LytT family response regulator